tara:strand:+ start:3298 stop:3897 length:600 start_codon:yes stop_codon:yes gene_type:complete
MNRKLHHCYQECDSSHKVWNDNYPDDPILVGQDIHHKNEIHEDNDPKNLEKLEHGEHTTLHSSGEKCNWFGKPAWNKGLTGEATLVTGVKNGRHISNLTVADREQISELQTGVNNSMYGVEPWNKGKKGLQVAWNKGVPMTQEQKNKISTTRKGCTPWNKGKARSEEVKKKISITKLRNKEQKQIDADVDQFFGGLKVA